jgi:hypothetical protein
MSATGSFQTAISSSIEDPPIEPFSQCPAQDTPNTAPQQTRLALSTDTNFEESEVSNGLPNPIPSPRKTTSTSNSRPSILDRLPRKEKELLEGVIERFKALDFSFDVKLFKRSKDVGQNSTAERLEGSVGIDASTSANETSVYVSTGVPPANGIQPSTAEFDMDPASTTTPTPRPTSSRALPEDPDANDRISPTYLAHKIQALLDSFPPPNDDSSLGDEQPFPMASPLLSTITTPPNSPHFQTVSALPPSLVSRRQGGPIPRSTLQQQPQPPPGTMHNADPELIEMLSSATIMNGSSSRGKRTSVWSVLEDLRAPRGWPRNRSQSQHHKEGQGAVVGATDVAPANGSGQGQAVEEEDDGDAFSDDSSIMMYSPLMPTTSSLVELAETEYMPMSMSVSDEGPYSSRGGVSEGRVVDGEENGGGEHEENVQTPTQTTHSAQSPELHPPLSSNSSTPAPQEIGSGVSWMNVWPFNTWSLMAESNGHERQHGIVHSQVAPKIEKKDKQTMTDPDPDIQSVAGPSSSAIHPHTPPEAPGADLTGGQRHPALTSSLTSEPSPPNPPTRQRPNFRVQGQRRWVPSTTKLSFEVLWWGYRMSVNHFSPLGPILTKPTRGRYLPPPVLSVLSDRQLEATKRAALITTALTWFFSNIPMNVIPPAVRPVVSLLKTLVPCVGYIGTFISWSWATMMGYDEGRLFRCFV